MLCLVCAAASARLAMAQSASYHGFIPFVLTPDSPPHVLFVAEIVGLPTRVTLDLTSGQTLDLHDAGQAAIAWRAIACTAPSCRRPASSRPCAPMTFIACSSDS